jgi:hypothetical protein
MIQAKVRKEPIVLSRPRLDLRVLNYGQRLAIQPQQIAALADRGSQDA